MKVTIEIPLSIQHKMSELGIPKQNWEALFKDYLNHTLGVVYDMESDYFDTWADMNPDNYTEYLD